MYNAWSCVQRYSFTFTVKNWWAAGVCGSCLGLAAPLAGLRFICLHKMADKLFTCKYKLRAWEAWHAFRSCCNTDIAFPFQKQPGLSLNFSAKDERLAKFIVNCRSLWCHLKDSQYRLGRIMSSKKESINIQEKIINSYVSNFYLFQRKRCCFILDSSN